jgi:arylsulfatase A-like enzyme
MADIGVLDDTLIVITADHGEEFKEHGDFGHNHKLYDELIHVPLIISNSSYRNIAIKDTVSLLDITPTIIDLLNIPETETFQEKSLIPIIEGKRKSSGVISEILDIQGKRVTSYRTKEWKYILSEAGNRRELYNIRKDPQERENVYEEEEEKVKEFESMILKHISDQIKMVRGVIDEKERIKGKIRELKTLREM